MKTFELEQERGCSFEMNTENQNIKLVVTDILPDVLALTGLELESSELSINEFFAERSAGAFRTFKTFVYQHTSIILTLDTSSQLVARCRLFYLGDGVVALQAPDHVTITKEKQPNFVAPKSYLPAGIACALEQIESSTPDTTEEIGYLLAQVDLTATKLIVLQHDYVTPSLEELIISEIHSLNLLKQRLKTKQHKLRKAPKLEALRKTILIEKLKTFLVQNGFEAQVSEFEIQALREASKSVADGQNLKSEPDLIQNLNNTNDLKQHRLHKRFEDFFRPNQVPFPLPIAKCKHCQSIAKLTKVKGAKGKALYQIGCSGCDTHPKSNQHKRASYLVYLWNKECADITMSPTEIKVLNYLVNEDPELKTYLQDLSNYLDLYADDIKKTKAMCDADQLSYFASIEGKIDHLRHAINLAKLFQKRRSVSKQ